MKQLRVNRRQFFKLTAFGASAVAVLPAIGLASVAAAPSKVAQAAAEQPLGPAIPQPTFNPIASNTTFGPLTDISMGWDGTVWGIDAQGAPHIYDEINKVWAPHGDGVDAVTVARLPNSPQNELGLYIFQGAEVIVVSLATLQVTTHSTIAAMWPSVPDSFKLGVTGATINQLESTGYGLILFNGGRFVSTDGSIPLTNLASLTNWPQTANWKDGIIDAVLSYGHINEIVLYRSGELVWIDSAGKSVTGQPSSFSDYNNGQGVPLPSTWSTVDAYVLTGYQGQVYGFVFNGTSVLVSNQNSPTLTPAYLGSTFGGWPSTWHPVLAHAPNGRDGNLWSVLSSAQGSYTMQHNGDVWTQQPFQADHVGVGQDNAVMLASAQKLWTVKPNANNTGYDVTSVSAASNLIQVSLGNANFVNARDTSGNVYNFNPTTGVLTPNTDVGTVVHIATTNDGSLWHAKSNDANMHRQLVGSGAQPEAIQVKQSLVTSVSKVAATGFGAAHCLVVDHQGNTDAYRYDSPYVFKTAAQYNVYGWVPTVIEQGAGMLFMIDTILVSSFPDYLTRTQIVSIDAHTGVEVSRTPMLDGTQEYGQPVFDPNLNLVYVGTAPRDDNDNSPGQLLALDAHDLTKVVWSYYTLAGGIDAAPALSGTQLCVGSRAGQLMMFNTATALANPTNVIPLWFYDVSAFQVDANRVATPIFSLDEGLIYVMSWGCTATGSGWNVQGTWNYFALDGSGGAGSPIHSVNNVGLLERLLTPPVPGMFNLANTSPAQLSRGFAINCYDAVIVAGTNPALTFTLPAGNFIQTGFAYDMDASGYEKNNGYALWFGTANGTLYGLDVNLTSFTAFTQIQNGSMNTTPVVYKDTQGGTTIYYNTFLTGTPDQVNGLYGFDPVNNNTASVPTGATVIGALTRSTTNGVIYAAGLIYNYDTSDGVYPQVFGIRVDALAQDLRDFIIESQLMQDPQDPGGTGGSTLTAPDGNIVPPSVARYQTHITVVDDQKHGLANEPMKIWADEAGTVITVNNQQYTIGPDDSAFASVTAGTDGSLVVMIDANDVNTSALRVWASFMDPYERMVVYPDHEWHGRAAQSNANGSVADPSKPNLNTAYSYKPDPNDSTGKTPKPLFTTDEKNQNTPTNVANAVGQMNTGLNPGGNSAASVAGTLKTLHASNPAAPYIAYTDLGSMHYGPNNARVKRTATITAPFGFVLNKPQGGAHTFTPLNHSDARSAIDALPYPLWDPNNPSGKQTVGNGSAQDKPAVFTIRRTDDAFTDFWNWLVGAFDAAVDAIENVIVSVADDIMVGINFIIDNVKQAFKAIIKVIDDVVNAIGSFFLQLAKLIEEVIEALCVLFHFGEIIWAHNWLKSLINHEVNGLKDSLTSNVKGLFDGFIQSGKDAIVAQFDTWRAQIGSQSFNDQRGGQSSVHSAFTVKDSNGNTSSQSVVAGANTQKLKSNLGSGQESSVGAAGVTQGAKSAQDAIGDFVTAFINRITGDGDLSAAFTQLQSDFSNLFNTQSASQFFSSAVTVLLDLLETALVGLLSVTGALVDGIFTVLDDLISTVLSFMNTPLDIPFFSWLYKLVFGSELTILDLIALVASIPGTMIFRVVTGMYPQDAGLPDPTSLPNGSTTPSNVQRAGFRPQATQATPKVVQIFAGLANALCILGLALTSAYSDLKEGEVAPWIGRVGFICGVIVAALSAPIIYSDLSGIYTFDWCSYGVSAFIALSGGIGLLISDPFKNKIFTVLEAFLNACCLAFIIYSYIDDPKGTTAVFAFIGNIFSALPGLVNPVKFLGYAGKIVAVFFDGAGNVIWMVMTLVAAFDNLNSAVRQRRLFFPWVAFNPQTAGTQSRVGANEPARVGTTP